MMQGGFASWNSTSSQSPYGYSSYGTPEADSIGAAEAQGAAFTKPPHRRRLNSAAIAQALILPWGIFTGVLYLMSFFVRYYHPELMTFLIFCSVAIVIGMCVMAVLQRLWHHGLERRDPSWFIFVAIFSAVAWIAAMALGGGNYSKNMQPYYDSIAMSVAEGADPGLSSAGAQYMDVSRIIFKPGATVRQDLSMGFKEGTTYCVAPITMGEDARYANYDFWAVGTDCCIPDRVAPQFWCGGHIADPDTHAGLRLLSDGGKYMNAVEQSEAEYGIKASHPIFLTWLKDPVGDVSKLRADGMSYFITCVIAYGVVQTLAVGATLFFYTWVMTGKAP